MSTKDARKSESEDDTSTDEKLDKFDEIWAWVVLSGIFIAMSLISIQAYLFGVLYQYHFKTTQISTTKIAWIFNTFQFTWDATSSLAGPLVEKWGYRNVGLISGFIYGVSTISTGFYSNANYLFISCSIFNGFGAGISYSLCQFIVPLYFKKRVGLAFGITATGLSFGQFCGPLLIDWLQANYGRFTPSIVGAIQLNICVSAMLFLPPQWRFKKHIKKEKWVVEQVEQGKLDDALIGGSTTFIAKEIDSEVKANDSPKSLCSLSLEIFLRTFGNLKLLKKPKVIIISLSMAFLFMAATNFALLLPIALDNKANFPVRLVPWCFSTSAIGTCVARLFVPALSDHLPISKMWYILTGSLIMAGSLVGFTVVTSQAAVLTMMFFFGFSLGSTVSFQSLLVIEFMGVDMLPAVWGANSVCMAAAFLCIGPLIGVVRDATQSYSISIIFIAMFPFCSAIMWSIMPFLNRSSKIVKHEETRQLKSLLPDV